MDEIDSIVVGAGAIGLAVARALALAGREVLILEGADRHRHADQSSRNCEVIHAGIYYPANGLKARLCVAGGACCMRICAREGHRAPPLRQADRGDQRAGRRHARRHQAPRRGQWRRRAFMLLDERQGTGFGTGTRLRRCAAVASTGIIDSHAFMLACKAKRRRRRGACVPHAHSSAGGGSAAMASSSETAGASPIVVERAGFGQLRRTACAGSCRRIEGMPRRPRAEAYYAKRQLFHPGRAVRRFRASIYPVPEPGGLGVHLTIDLGGQARFGPDVEWIDGDFDYTVDPDGARAFYPAMRTLLACSEGGDLASGLCRRSGPRFPARARLQRISASRDRRSTACRDWSTCSESNRPG